MADPEHALAKMFQEAIARAFGPEYSAVDAAIRASAHADYQANVALGLKGRLGKPPREIAAAIVSNLETGALVERAAVAGPGFINVTVRAEALARELSAVASDPRLGVPVAEKPEIVVIDYSSPNLAKEMHVGHLRSTILGDALARVLEALGHRVLRQNHLGDWGTPFGMLIEHLVDLGELEGGRTLGELVTFYQEARSKFDGDIAFADRSRRRVVLLQSGDGDTLSLWQRLVDLTARHARELYEKLGVTLDENHVRGESFYNALLPEVVRELEDKGLAVRNDGALCVFLPGFSNREGSPLPLIVQKKDGGYGYATTDLAALKYRLEVLHATRVLVVAGAPQSQHFDMVFAAARLAGWLAPPARAAHVAFGSILGADGRMFKTRAGKTVRLLELIDEAVDRARAIVVEKNPDLDPETREEVARAVGVGAVKYADLSSDRLKDYVFDYARMLAFDGNTAPYLQYAHARIRSIFRRGAVLPPPPSAVRVSAPAEKSLALVLLRFPAVVGKVEGLLEPHQLCTYLYDLATAFSAFYEACPVLKAATEEERAGRLALSDLTARVLERGLGLLGIQAPDRM